jgi:membrane protease YdiL (CAAX protease family)
MNNASLQPGIKNLQLVIVSEIIVVLIAIAICGYRDSWPTWDISLRTTALGSIASFVLFFLLKKLALAAKDSDGNWASEINELRRQFAQPLAKSFSVWQAALSGLLAGTAEEFLFRGAIENVFPLYWGALIGAFIFILAHFGRKALEWKFISVVYLVVSLYFSTLYQSTHSLWAAAVCHGLYDFLALRFLANRFPN